MLVFIIVNQRLMEAFVVAGVSTDAGLKGSWVWFLSPDSTVLVCRLSPCGLKKSQLNGLARCSDEKKI